MPSIFGVFEKWRARQVLQQLTKMSDNTPDGPLIFMAQWMIDSKPIADKDAAKLVDDAIKTLNK